MKWNILVVFLVLALAIGACGNQNNAPPDTTNVEVQENNEVVQEWEDWDDEYENEWDDDWDEAEWEAGESDIEVQS